MDIHVNDILKMKKAHPCGSQEWLVLRVGLDFKLRCQGCSHEVMLPRSKAEKNIRKVLRDGQPVENLYRKRLSGLFCGAFPSSAQEDFLKG